MIELQGGMVVAEEATDKVICRLATEVSSDSKPTLFLIPTEEPVPFNEVDSNRILKGLARISLEAPDYDYHGLTQRLAKNIIGNMSDDAEYFFYPILAEAER